MTKIKDYIRGDTRVIAVYCYQSDGVTPMNLTGCTVYFTVNASNSPTDDSSAAFQKIVTSFIAPTGILLPTGITAGQDTSSLGIAWPKIVTSDTQNLTPGVFYYDVQIKDASGNITSNKQDEFDINADITRTNT